MRGLLFCRSAFRSVEPITGLLPHAESAATRGSRKESKRSVFLIAQGCSKLLRNRDLKPMFH